MIPADYAHLPPHISLAEASAVVGVSKRALYRWMRDGKVEFVYTAGGSRRIVTASLWRAPGENSSAPVVSGLPAPATDIGGT